MAELLNNVVTAVDIRLTRDEAKTLLAVCRSIGGHPKTSRRGNMDAIQKVLYESGLTVSDGWSGDLPGALHFNET